MRCRAGTNFLVRTRCECGDQEHPVRGNPTPAPAGGSSPAPGAPAADDPSNTPPESDPSLPATPKSTGAPVDLWDSGWPNGRFYWTVVPVRFETAQGGVRIEGALIECDAETGKAASIEAVRVPVS